jgi:hypothetical protein
MWLSQSKTGKFLVRPLALYGMSGSLHGKTSVRHSVTPSARGLSTVFENIDGEPRSVYAETLQLRHSSMEWWNQVDMDISGGILQKLGCRQSMPA